MSGDEASRDKRADSGKSKVSKAEKTEKTKRTAADKTTEKAVEYSPFNAADETAQTLPVAPEVGNVTWTAPEFLAHDKDIYWYLTLTGIAAVLATIVMLLTKDKISTIVVIVAAIMFGVYAARKPRILPYELDQAGLHVAEKFYDYGQFRSFFVLDEGNIRSITFIPLRRLMPGLTIYFQPEDEPGIVRILSDRMPMENREHDLLDDILHKIRF
jgi:hypothetical protein